MRNLIIIHRQVICFKKLEHQTEDDGSCSSKDRVPYRDTHHVHCSLYSKKTQYSLSDRRAWTRQSPTPLHDAVVADKRTDGRAPTSHSPPSLVRRHTQHIQSIRTLSSHKIDTNRVNRTLVCRLVMTTVGTAELWIVISMLLHLALLTRHFDGFFNVLTNARQHPMTFPIV